MPTSGDFKTGVAVAATAMMVGSVIGTLFGVGLMIFWPTPAPAPKKQDKIEYASNKTAQQRINETWDAMRLHNLGFR